MHFSLHEPLHKFNPSLLLIFPPFYFTPLYVRGPPPPRPPMIRSITGRSSSPGAPPSSPSVFSHLPQYTLTATSSSVLLPELIERERAEMKKK